MADDWFRKPLVLRPPDAEIELRRDVVYHQDLLADIYRPRDSGDAPIIILIHGGPIPEGARMKGLPIFTDYGRLLAASGFIAVTFNHRYFSADDRLRALGDVEALIDFVHAELPPALTFLWAFSGGGAFLSAAFDRPYVRGLIAFYASLRALIDPLQNGGAKLPPTFVARAGRDYDFINEAVQQFVDLALTHNVELELMNHPEGGHGFDILNDDDRSRAIIARTIEFIREHGR